VYIYLQHGGGNYCRQNDVTSFLGTQGGQKWAHFLYAL